MIPEIIFYEKDITVTYHPDSPVGPYYHIQSSEYYFCQTHTPPIIYDELRHLLDEHIRNKRLDVGSDVKK